MLDYKWRPQCDTCGKFVSFKDDNARIINQEGREGDYDELYVDCSRCLKKESSNAGL